MTTAGIRQTDLRPLLPIALVVVMLGVAGLIALVAPSRATGVHQVVIGRGSTWFKITAESLDCDRVGDKASCSLPVAGRPLEITVVYADDKPFVPANCTAVHGGRQVTCSYGLSHSVLIADPLGVTDAERDRWRDAVPWWREPDRLVNAAFALVGLLSTTAGVVGYLLGRRFRLESPRRLRMMIGTGLAGWLLFAAVGFMLVPGGKPWLGLILPHFLTAAAALALWQWQLGGMSGGSRKERWGYALGSAAATAVYSGIALVFFLLMGAIID